MGTASLIIGIVCLIIALIPLFGGVIFTPAIAGLVLGIIYVSEKAKKKEPKKKGIAGIVLCSLAIVITIVYYILVGVFAVSTDLSGIGIFKSAGSQKEVRVGESVEFEGLTVKFLSINSNYTNYIEQRKVKDGYRIIKLVVDVKNNEDSSKYISAYDFKCYADDYVCNNIYFETESGIDVTLTKNRRVQGNLFFEVPINCSNITVEYVTYGVLPIPNKLVLDVK